MAPFVMTLEEMEAALVAGGLSDVVVESQEMELAWASPESAAAAVMGTPYSTTIAPLGAGQQAEIHAALVAAMTGDDGRVNHVQHVVMARGVASRHSPFVLVAAESAIVSASPGVSDRHESGPAPVAPVRHR